ncbi:Uncharacterized protein GY17_00000005, partial [Cryptosporidium hominis]
MKFLSNLSIISILAVIAVFYSFTSTESDLVSSGHYEFSFIKVKCGGKFCSRLRKALCCCTGGDDEDQQQPIEIGPPTNFQHLQTGGLNMRGPNGQLVSQLPSPTASGSGLNNEGYQSDNEDENE